MSHRRDWSHSVVTVDYTSKFELVIRVMDIGSPPSHVNRDEVIADSEEELEYAKSFSGVWSF